MYLQLGRPAIRGNFLVDITVRAAQDGLGNHYQGRREEIVPFFASLNRTMYYTLCGVAERVGLAHTEPRRLLTNPDLRNEFSAKAKQSARPMNGRDCLRMRKRFRIPYHPRRPTDVAGMRVTQPLL